MDAEMTSSGRMRWTIARLTQMDKHRIVHTDSTTTSSLSLVPILLLLVSSGLVHSESTSNVTIAPSSASPNVQARSENFLSPDIASLVNLTSVGFKGLVDSSGNEALINGDNDGVSESSKTRDDAVAERQRSLEGARSETTELRDSLAVTEILPEFADKEVRDEVVNLEDENDSREPTTVPTSSRKIEESKEEEKYDKDGSGEYDLNDIGRSNREYNFSLINDTNVNYYASTKNARVGDDVVVLGETDHQSIDSDANVVNGPSGSKLISAGQVATTVDNNDTSLLDEAATWKSLAVRGDEGSTRGDITESIRDDETNRQGPKQQTQEAVGVDSENNKDSMKNLDVTNRDKGSTDFEPYPYARGGKIHEDTSNGAETPTSTEDASALENTIGLKENNGGSIVTAAVSPSSFAVDSVNGTESPVQSNQEDRKNLWRTSLDSEKSDGYTTTPKIESTFPRGAFWNVSNFSEDTSLDYNESVKVWTTMMTTTDDESTKNSTIDPIVISGVATVQDEANNSSPVTMDNLSSAATSLPTVSSETMTKESLQLKDDAPFRVSTETSTTNEATSPSSFSTATLERLTNDIATDDIRETEESLRSELPIESTTAGVEYEFIGLTESTSPKYIDTTSTEDQSSAATSSIETSTLISTSLDSSYSLSTLSTEEAERFDETSTNPPSTTVETETVTDYTVDSSSSDSAEPETTKSWSETATTSVEDSQSTTASLTTETNFEVSPSPTTENGRFVDSSTVMIPEISTISENSSSTLVQQSESPGSSMDVNETTESTRYPVTSANPPLVSPTEPSSSTPRYSDINFETEEKGKVTSRPGGRAISEKEATILVRIIFEGTWLDVCPYLPALRQSLADLLTSGLEKTVLASQIIYQKNPCSDGFISSSITTEYSVTMLLLYVVDKNGNLDAEMTKILPSLYNGSPIKQQQVNIRTFQLVQDGDSSNAIAVVVVSCVALICLVLLAGLLFIMRKRQTRFNYGERCRPVSLDAYSLDSVSAYNSVRGRKTGAARASKRSYGNPTFEDSTVTPSHPLNFAGLSAFCDEREKITEEFATIPQVTARIDELPNGAEVKNRYANVVPLPETRVSLARLSNDPLTEYINASYVRGPKNATRYYIACQAPMESTVMDFWRMIWEQQSKVIIMLTDLVENGVEKCAEYVPPSEVTDCHRLYGDYQVTLKKRETKERYAISTLHLKNLESNTFREVFHIWYLWPTNGMQSDAAGLIAVLLEARALQRGGPGPVVVHCSPGTGRTGTLIALDLTIRQYEITRTVDVPRVVCTIRRDRAGAVQTKEQYGFIYKALNLYATKLAGGALES